MMHMMHGSRSNHPHAQQRAALLVLAGTALAATSIAMETPTGLVERANEAFRSGSLSRAVDLYEKADELAPDDALTLYNWATALAASDERGLAERMFRKADGLAASDQIRARARFNLAHSLFVTASSLTEEDPHRAIELFDESARAARAALKINPADTEAARHVEVSRLAAKLVRDQLELAERVQDLADQQRKQSRASQNAHREQTQPQQEQPQQEEQQQEDAQQQEQQQQPSSEPGEQQSPPQLPQWLQDLLGPMQSQGEGDTRSPQSQQPQSQPPHSEPPQIEPRESPPAQQDEESQPQEPQQTEAEQPQPGGGRPPESQPPESTLGEAQQDLNEQTQGVAETLRRAIENDLVAGDRDFVERVLEAIEAARDAQDDAKQSLESERFDDASGEQEQAASLLELAEQMMARRQGQPQPSPRGDPGDSDPQGQSGEGPDMIDEEALELLDKERREREMRRDYQRRIMRGRRAPARDW